MAVAEAHPLGLIGPEDQEDEERGETNLARDLWVLVMEFLLPRSLLNLRWSSRTFFCYSQGADHIWQPKFYQSYSGWAQVYDRPRNSNSWRSGYFKQAHVRHKHKTRQFTCQCVRAHTSLIHDACFNDALRSTNQLSAALPRSTRAPGSPKRPGSPLSPKSGWGSPSYGKLEGGALAATCSADKTVKLWNSDPQQQCQCVTQFPWMKGTPINLCFVDTSLLAVTSTEREVKLFDTHCGTCSGGFRADHDVTSISAAVGQNDSAPVICTTSWNPDKTVRIWDHRAPICIGMLTGHTDRQTKVVMCPRIPDRAVSAGEDGVVRVWDLRKREVLEQHKGDPSPNVLYCDEQMLAFSTKKRRVKLLPWQSGIEPLGLDWARWGQQGQEEEGGGTAQGVSIDVREDSLQHDRNSQRLLFMACSPRIGAYFNVCSTDPPSLCYLPFERLLSSKALTHEKSHQRFAKIQLLKQHPECTHIVVDSSLSRRGQTASGRFAGAQKCERLPGTLRVGAITLDGSTIINGSSNGLLWWWNFT